MKLLPREGEPLPRAVRYVAIPLIGFFLLVLFIHRGFPYEVLVAKALQSVDPSTPAHEREVSIHYGEVTSYLGFLGPGVQAHDVVVARRDDDDIRIARLILRPAWSTTWFRGQPSVYFDAQTPTGRVRGAVAVGDPGGFDGSVQRFDLNALPLAVYLGGVDLGGLLDADIDVHYDAEDTLRGTAQLAAIEGSLGLPGQPVAIPYDSLDAELVLGGEDGEFLTIDTAELKGPMLSVSASGRVMRSGSGPGALDLDLELTVEDENMESVLRRLGVRTDQDGKATVKVGGTMLRPSVR